MSGNPYIWGYYRNTQIAGAYYGNVTGLGFTANITTYDDGTESEKELIVKIDEASFHITKYRGDTQSTASAIFQLAYNSALTELQAYIDTGYNPKSSMELEADFLNLVNINLNLDQNRRGSGFVPYFSMGNIPTSNAKFIP